MNLKKLSIALIGGALAAVLIAQTSQSNSNTSSKNGSAQASASSSSSSNSSGSKSGFASGSGSRNAFGFGSGSAQGSMANVTHAIMYTLDTSVNRTESANQQLQENHNKYFADLKTKGKVVLYGPWRDMSGAMTIVSAESDDEATDIARND